MFRSTPLTNINISPSLIQQSSVVSSVNNIASNIHVNQDMSMINHLFNQDNVRLTVGNVNCNTDKILYTHNIIERKMFCIYCRRETTFNNGVGIPVSKSSTGKYYFIDIFCTINCALAELNIRKNCDEGVNYKFSYKYMRDICTSNGINFDDIKPSPDKRLLIEFNGSLTHEQYFKNFYTPKVTCPSMFIETRSEYFHNH